MAKQFSVRARIERKADGSRVFGYEYKTDSVQKILDSVGAIMADLKNDCYATVEPLQGSRDYLWIYDTDTAEEWYKERV